MVGMTRRGFAASAAASALVAPRVALAAADQPPLARVIADNDFSGDPDGLYQLAHQVLSPAIDVPLVVGSHLPTLPFLSDRATATEAAAKAGELLGVMRRSGLHRVVAGSEVAMPDRADWKPSPATAAIVQEAMREDAAGPLVYAAGAGLTEPALAWLAEPRIGKRMRLVWIGGNEHPDLAAPPPGPAETEFNFTIDPVAAQVLFNESDVEIWQVPRDVYRQLLFTRAELAELAQGGPLGRYLLGEIEGTLRRVRDIPGFVAGGRSETWVMGDSPLVTLTALLSMFQPDTTSSAYVVRPTPTLADDGSYRANPAGRPMRIYRSVDTRLTLSDMVAKIRQADAALR